VHGRNGRSNASDSQRIFSAVWLQRPNAELSI
jgi:hypothetical protein